MRLRLSVGCPKCNPLEFLIGSFMLHSVLMHPRGGTVPAHMTVRRCSTSHPSATCVPGFADDASGRGGWCCSALRVSELTKRTRGACMHESRGSIDGSNVADLGWDPCAVTRHARPARACYCTAVMEKSYDNHRWLISVAHVAYPSACNCHA